MTRGRRVFFTADEHRLEGMLSIPERAPSAVVLCHPHPEYGGSMDNPVVAVASEQLRRAGVAKLPGADHFLGGFESQVGEAVVEFLSSR